MSVYKNNLCFDQNLLCVVRLYLLRSCLELVAYSKTNTLCLFFCLISKLFTLGNITFNSNININDVTANDVIKRDQHRKEKKHELHNNH